jgi:hypothetical protein
MHLIYNDSQLFREICSTMINGDLKHWTGKMWTVGNPDVVCDFIEAAQDKHMPLPQGGEKEE